MPATYQLIFKRSVRALILLLLLGSSIFFTGCKKNIPFSAAAPADYFIPLQVGKFAMYRLDSLNFYYYGQKDTITRYLAKDTVEAASTDNQGRPSWTIVRYLNDTTGKGPWIPAVTYLVTPTPQTLEVVENNLRFSKLAYPVNEGVSWTGNTYLPYAPFRDYFKFSDGGHLSIQDWKYTYQQVNKPWQSINKSYDSTTTILQVNNSVNVPITSPAHSPPELTGSKSMQNISAWYTGGLNYGNTSHPRQTEPLPDTGSVLN